MTDRDVVKIASRLWKTLPSVEMCRTLPKRMNRERESLNAFSFHTVQLTNGVTFLNLCFVRA